MEKVKKIKKAAKAFFFNINMIKLTFQNISVILLMSAVALSFGFNFGVFGGGKAIELRMEDFLIVFLGVFFVFKIISEKKWKLEKPPVFYSIVIWLSVLLLTTLLNLALHKLPFDRAFFYYGKQVEFFVFYFYVFWQVKDIKSAKALLNIFLFLGIVNAGYVVLQGITGKGVGEYGASAIAEKGVFPTGAFFLFFSIFSINLFLHYYRHLKISPLEKGILGLALASPVLGLFGSDSKTNFLAFVFAFLLMMFFLFLKEKSLKSIFIVLLILAVFVFIFLFALENIPYVIRLVHVLNPLNIIPNFQTGRMVVIGPLLEEIVNYPSMAFFGFGTGYIGEAHNQFLRNYIENGVIGSIAFFLLFFSILKVSFIGFLKAKDRFLAGVSSSIFIATMAMLFNSLATDAIFVVKPSEVYWIFAALSFSVIKFSLPKKELEEEILPKKESEISIPEKKNILAVVVAHDPDENFIENLKITAEQVDKIVVVNNGSPKITQNVFDNSWFSEKVFLISNRENLGQGRALNQGANWAKENGFKWVLLLDQDSRAREDMVQKQIEAFLECDFKNKLGLVGVNCTFKGTGEVKYFYKNKTKYFERDVVMASGSLLPLNAFLKTGQFREEFFVDSIDADYCLRLRKKGFKLIVAQNAMMEQRVGSEGKMKRFLWRKILVTNHPSKRCYYMARNGLILVKEHFFSEFYWSLRRIAWHLFIKPLFIILYEKDKINKIKGTIKGIFHALINKTGR